MVRPAVAWETLGICPDSDVNFFAESDLPENPTQAETDSATLETIRARTICANCPVRRECLESAITNKHRFGVWGGADEKTLRKALSIDEEGHAVPRARDMVCPYCYNRDLTIKTRRRTQTQMYCDLCDLGWWAAKPIQNTPIPLKDADEFGNDME